MKSEGIFELYRRNAEAAEQRDKPQPTKTVYAPGSMEWQAQTEKDLADRKAAAEEKEQRRLARLATFLGKKS